MAKILELIAVLVPVELAFFYAVNSRAERHMQAPIVALSARAVSSDLDEAAERYRRHFTRGDPFAPQRVGADTKVLTLHDLSPAQRALVTPTAADGLSLRASLYLRDGGRIVGGIGLVRVSGQPDLSHSEITVIRAAQPLFEHAYQLSRRTTFGTQALNVSLTAREQEIAELIATGASNAEISEILHITPNTVKIHVKHLLTKLGVANRRHAMIALSGRPARSAQLGLADLSGATDT